MPDTTHLDENDIACYAHGVLPNQQRATVEAHLADCAECRAEVLELHRSISTDKRRTVTRYISIAATAAAAAVIFVVAVPRAGRDAGPEIPLVATNVSADAGPVVSTQWLAGHITDPSVVVLHVDADETGWNAVRYADGHIPSAREIQFASITFVRDGKGVEIPPADSMRSYFESRGVSDGSHVVLTGQPLAVARAYLTLSTLGIARVSVLDGGRTKWRAEGRPLESGAPGTLASVPRGRITLRSAPSLVVDREFVLAHVGKPGVAYIDTRTDAEYVGQASWKGVQSTGHIAGARQIDWQDYFQNDSDFTLKPRVELERLIAARALPGDTVVAYCFNGGRSSSTLLVARVLGHPALLYDGSYQDWNLHHEPTQTTRIPLLTD
jgi:thiosulfate/3-mercaptopyruvate sulfurtransferase